MDAHQDNFGEDIVRVALPGTHTDQEMAGDNRSRQHTAAVDAMTTYETGTWGDANKVTFSDPPTMTATAGPMAPPPGVVLPPPGQDSTGWTPQRHTGGETVQRATGAPAPAVAYSSMSTTGWQPTAYAGVPGGGAAGADRQR